MNSIARRRVHFIGLLVVAAFAASACAATAGIELNQDSATPYLGDDGLFHLAGTTGVDGTDLPEASISNGIWTTASVARLAQQQGSEFAPEQSTIDTLRAAAAAAPAKVEEDVTLSLGVARLCSLLEDSSPECKDAIDGSKEWLDTASVPQLSGLDMAKLLTGAGDLGDASFADSSVFAEAFPFARDDECAQSDLARYNVRTAVDPELHTTPEPRKLTDEVLEALRERDIASAYCKSGVVAITDGATPAGEGDWLREPFHEAISRSFVKTDTGLYRINRGSGMDPLVVSMMLSQIAFDLSVELP